MNIKILCIFLCLVSPNINSSEQKEPHRHSHSSHKKHSDITINIESPTPPQSYNDLVDRHKVELKKTKIKVAAFVTIATSIIAGGIALLIHYTTGGCPK